MEATNATNWESEARETEGYTVERESNAGSQARIDGNSTKLGNIGQRTAGTSGTQANKDTHGGGYTGGILDQMIVDCEDRLAEAKACIEWYQNVQERELKRRENLRQLEEMKEKELQQQQNQSQSPSE